MALCVCLTQLQMSVVQKVVFVQVCYDSNFKVQVCPLCVCILLGAHSVVVVTAGLLYRRAGFRMRQRDTFLLSLLGADRRDLMHISL